MSSEKKSMGAASAKTEHDQQMQEYIASLGIEGGEADRAAVKIQAVHRGHRFRREALIRLASKASAAPNVSTVLAGKIDGVQQNVRRMEVKIDDVQAEMRLRMGGMEANIATLLSIMQPSGLQTARAGDISEQ